MGNKKKLVLYWFKIKQQITGMMVRSTAVCQCMNLSTFEKLRFQN